MRIVIDMQGAQSESRSRGIGRYSLAFAQAIARNRGTHEVLLALNGLFPETIEQIQRAFKDMLPRENIRVWEAPGPLSTIHEQNTLRRQRAQIIYETFLASLKPDIVHITSLFEGFCDDVVTSIARFTTNIPTSVTFYDLIPLHDPAWFLNPNPTLKKWYFEKLAHLKKADLLLAISDFSADDAHRRLDFPEKRITNVSTGCTDFFRPLQIPDDTRSALLSRLGIDHPFILTSGTLEPHKNLNGLFRAFSTLPDDLRQTHCLVLIGRIPNTQRPVFTKMLRDAGLSESHLLIMGHVSDEDLVSLYNLCELMVFPSMDEGFGLPALEAMTCGAPTIGSNAASIPEVIGRQDALFNPHDISDMARLITRVLTDAPFREDLKTYAINQASKFSWDATAHTTLRAIEKLLQERKSILWNTEEPLAGCIQALAKFPTDEIDTLTLAQSLARTFPPPMNKKQLFIDVSELSQRDARTGCQRVTRSIVLKLLKNPPKGMIVEPVYATLTEPGYRYARAFTAKLLGKQTAGEDDPIDFAQGDMFFGLDYQAHIVTRQQDFLLTLRHYGVAIRFLVYDLLSIRMPAYFPILPEDELIVRRWLETLALFDGIIGISQATTNDLAQWYREQNVQTKPGFRFDWVHLGADIENSAPTYGLPDGSNNVLKQLSQRQTFLMVSTIEPRKGYAQALAAFDLLWSRGTDVNLVIVGKEGWDVTSLIERLRTHPEMGHRLFWLEGISDEYLEKVYAASTCLIAASEGEGFGLPLIEAARHKLPILARDIPVFREVAGDHAAYFSGLTPEDLAESCKKWLSLYKDDLHPRSDDMPWLTWAQSAQQMMQIVLQ